MICAIAGFPMAHQWRSPSAPLLPGAYSPLAWRKCRAIGKGPMAHQWRNPVAWAYGANVGALGGAVRGHVNGRHFGQPSRARGAPA